MSDPGTRATAEIVRMHEFLSSWFRGEIDQARFAADFTDRLDPVFENIQPAGTVLSKAELETAIYAGHGTNPDFQISIETPRLLGTWPGLILAGYVEYQTGARASAAENRRRSTVLFADHDGGLIWRYLQETGLPG
ncbi:MAG: hypothetical protein AAGI13_06755 [Pseudomonadota bacterium]